MYRYLCSVFTVFTVAVLLRSAFFVVSRYSLSVAHDSDVETVTTRVTSRPRAVNSGSARNTPHQREHREERTEPASDQTSTLAPWHLSGFSEEQRPRTWSMHACIMRMRMRMYPPAGECIHITSPRFDPSWWRGIGGVRFDRLNGGD